MKADIKDSVGVPEGMEFSVSEGIVTIGSGSEGLSRRFVYPKIVITKESNEIIFSSKNATKREKRIINSFKAHIRNMIKGVESEYVYRLMICSSHFPMNVAVDKNELVIKNFLGEKTPRKTKIIEGVSVSVEGNIIFVKSKDIEKAGQIAGKIEKLTMIKGRDRRIFQDGCYIIDKAGKLIK